MPKLCSVNDCKDQRLARELCSKHYQRLRLTGSPTGTLRKPQDQRFWAKVDKTSTCWLWTGAKTNGGYGMFRVDDRRVSPAHRFSYEALVGPIPDGLVIDHICHNTSCVNPEHLRPATHKQNLENLNGANVGSKSGVRGVYPCKGKWRAQVIHEYRRYNIGYFDDIAEAERAVIAKRNELFTHNDLDRVA